MGGRVWFGLVGKGRTGGVCGGVGGGFSFL